VDAAAARAAEGAAPPSDLRADAAYRSHLAQVLTAKALGDAGAGR
jgi:carbon-monoxide dehydrogenase medium subunit